MNPIESLRISWRSIRGHRLRSTLTVLGVIIGIAAVITFATLGTGLQDQIVGDISPDNQQNIYVWGAPAESSGQGPLAGAKPVVTQRDGAEVSNLSAVEDAYVYTQIPGQSVSSGDQSVPKESGLVATAPAYFDDEDIGEGRRFESGTTEVVINPDMADLFDPNITVGDTLRLGLYGGTQINSTVVGILKNSESKSAFGGINPSPRLYLPADYSGTESSDEAPRYIGLIVEAPSSSDGAIDSAKQETRQYLNSADSDAGQRAEAADLSFELRTSAELIGQLEGLLDILQSFVIGIAAISLLVGSVGIANIMLVSVTERTREIGIMKAVGAQRRDILGLFVVESIILGLLGAIFGTLLGLGAGYAAAELIGLPWTFPTMWALIAVVTGIVVGVLAGLYPAWRASRTDPIDALRYE
jgi:putative ABC transport system permease protein